VFTDSQLEILNGILSRREDNYVTEQEYDELTHRVRQEQSMRKDRHKKEQERRARVAAIGTPNIPKAFNDPVDW
jgi:hypothetical protein